MISSKAYLSNGVLIKTSQPKVQLAPPKQMNFRKSSERGGGGGHFQSKNYVADFGPFKQGLRA